MKKLGVVILSASIIFSACHLSRESTVDGKTAALAFIDQNFKHADTMLSKLLDDANQNFNEKDPAYPRTINKNGELVSTSMYDWTPGFFPGNLWQAYEYLNSDQYKSEARRWTESLAPLQTFTGNHDLGFMMYCSYGNAYRLTKNESYKSVLINAAKALSTRYNATTGCIKSWNVFRSKHGDAEYHFPVIIDNMMNLEMLFFASKISGDTSFRHIAITHALTTMKNHIRPDYSSYHVVCYDSTSGKVLARETSQGFADNSTWARGQAWALYGFTMCYRETEDQRFLTTALGLADYIVNNKNLPTDKIPYWDFNADEPGYTPGVKSHALEVTGKFRDVSSASIIASALFELSTYAKAQEAQRYKDVAIKILHSLSSPGYTAQLGTNGHFILEHSVGSIPDGVEIDVPLVYADYYYLEALIRYKKLLEGEKII